MGIIVNFMEIYHKGMNLDFSDQIFYDKSGGICEYIASEIFYPMLYVINIPML